MKVVRVLSDPPADGRKLNVRTDDLVSTSQPSVIVLVSRLVLSLRFFFL